MRKLLYLCRRDAIGEALCVLPCWYSEHDVKLTWKTRNLMVE